MRYLYVIIAVLVTTTSCELRSTNFDPDNQLVSDDELAQIAVWDQYQTEEVSTEEYEIQNPNEFIETSSDYIKDAKGNWIIDGTIKNFATTAQFKNAQFVVLFFNDSNKLIGTENYTINKEFAPGHQATFQFQSEKYADAQSLQIHLSRIRSDR